MFGEHNETVLKDQRIDDRFVIGGPENSVLMGKLRIGGLLILGERANLSDRIRRKAGTDHVKKEDLSMNRGVSSVCTTGRNL